MYNAALSTTYAVTTLAIFFLRKLCLVIRGYIFYNPATCTKQSPTRQFGPTLSLTRG